jgi:hypothetical protein
MDSELPVVQGKLAIGIGVVFASIVAGLIAPGAHAQDACSVEVKLLLVAQATQTAVASLGFEKVGTSRVYFFDTEALNLFAQGLILRIRQGATNDFAVKVRLPGGGSSALRSGFRCEIDRTPAGSSTSYTVGRSYRAIKVPGTGDEIYRLLSASQKQLLAASKAQVDWTAVRTIVEVTSTTWRTKGRVALELWDWPEGKILELSQKTVPAAEDAKYAQLEGLVRAKQLLLSDVQDNKTSVVLRARK